ncbi:glycerol uptake facilitator protein [Solirubrobacter pauli]|uniref:Glycerol uptake facilitator protein n=1 Tax=Solirubrobacter pauli TaxID=166793 RepID=A0A660KY40_9ACTN|nr:MIP/aquaporin family protein [Solirubrobacter pauli]RKQ84926.1 glycerol uptake facilitator protein [Solirubrobacter pauli]
MSGTRRWRWQQSVLGEHVAEFLGTLIIILLGCGVVAMAVAALNQSGRGDLIFAASGDWLLITWGWGFAVCFAVYVAGGVSGAHLNPAVTLALAWRRGFPWNKVPGYIVAQVLGAFVGAALVYLNYRYAIISYEDANKISRGAENSVPTYSIFGTFPAPYYENFFGPFLDQVIGTAILVAFIFAVTDEYNAPVKANLAPVVIGFIVVAVGISFGANAGYAINPARDFGPRMFAWFAGWGEVAMPGNYGNVNTYFWVPILGPIVGAGIGAAIYDFGIRNVLIARGIKPDTDVAEEGRTAIDD